MSSLPEAGPMRLVTAVAVSAALPAAPQAATAGPGEQCYDREGATTYEESRIETPALPGGTRVPYELVEAGGFTPWARGLTEALCRSRSAEAAQRMLARRGAQLWQAAVLRAQGRVRMGTIDRYDDRPLYWTRLLGTRDLRQWRPAFPLTEAGRTRLLRTFDYASRGITSVRPGPGDRKVLVSGFDPDQPSGEIRRSNPSGAAALQLDGRSYTADGRRIRVQAVMLPVTWSGFDAGIVEDAFGPHLTTRSRDRADLIMTISQGGRGVMAVEQWAGAWRGGSPDNNGRGVPQPVPPAGRWPQPYPQPEFIETTLPHEAMAAAGTGPWPTTLNPRLCEWPPGTRPDPAAVRCHSGAPVPGFQAQSGGSGNHLANESTYRTSRLRLALDATDVPAGHLHVSALVYPADPLVLTGAAFTADRAATVEQTVALVKAAGAAA